MDGAYAPSTVPNPDAISEFKIQTSQNDAMFGAMVPNTNLMTRRGGNDFHGSAWEFLRNDLFNANAFFRNATGQPKPNLKQNQFGATAGGPVRRKELFFFASYQGTRQTNGLDPTSISNLILPALTEDRSATALARQFCAANHAGDPRYETYAGGKQLDCANRNTAETAGVNPVALRLLQTKDSAGRYLIPSPQTRIAGGPNAGLGFSTYSMPSTYQEHHFLGNGDYVISHRDTLSARVFAATVDQLRTFGSPGGYPGAPMCPGSALRRRSPPRLGGQPPLHHPGNSEHRERGSRYFHPQPFGYQRGRYAGRGVHGNHAGRSVVFRIRRRSRCWDRWVPSDCSDPTRTITISKPALTRSATTSRGFTARTGFVAAGSSSRSTTAGPTPEAHAAGSPSRRSKIFWLG